MKFTAKVKVDVGLKGGRISKDDLTPLVRDAIESTLEDQLFDALYDLVSTEVETAEDKELELEVTVDEVDI